MITESDFEELIRRPESTTLDFKKEQYKIINDESGIKTAEFVKDLICFSNTIRTESAYIIIGISSNENNDKQLLGLDFNIDDAIFQEKVKDKVFPKPIFLYYPIRFQGKDFGIIEIPVTKHSEPMTPIVKLKGLEVGKIYIRRGSSNSEAIGREILLIDKWLNSLPSINDILSISDEVSKLLSELTSNKIVLSNAISEAFRIAKKYNLIKLLDFCNGELMGWRNTDDESIQRFLNYRLQSAIVSSFQIEINAYNPNDSRRLYNELKTMDNFHERNIIFSEPISQLESILKRFNEKPDSTIATFTTTAERFFDNQELGDIPIIIYTIKDNFDSIYNRIKQKLIDELVTI